MLDFVVVALTGSIAAAAGWMSLGLLRKEPARVNQMRAVGFTSPAMPAAFGLSLATAAVCLVVGWWIKPVGIVGIVGIKLLYLSMMIAYRRAGQKRDRDQAAVLMTSHSLVALGLIIAS